MFLTQIEPTKRFCQLVFENYGNRPARFQTRQRAQHTFSLFVINRKMCFVVINLALFISNFIHQMRHN